MAPLLENKGDNAHNYNPDVDTGQDHNNDSPQAALEKVLSFNNELPDYSTLTISPKLGTIIQLQKLVETSNRLQEIIDRPDCDDETKQSATALMEAIDARFSHVVSGADLKKLLQTPDARIFTSNPDVDIDNYQTTAPLVSALIDEQVPNADGNPKELIGAIDTGIIAETVEQRVNYAKTHELESIHDKAKAFTDLLESLNDTMSKINTKGNLPVTKAINNLLSAKALHDLALLGELGSIENRDIALRAAINDLWDAKSQIESAPESDVAAGILRDVMIFIEIYSKEIGIDPKTQPNSEIFDITPKERVNAVTKLGEAATSYSTPPRAA